MKKQTVISMMWIILALASIGGWIANIVKLVGMIDGQLTGMFVARAIGMVVGPLGAVLGFF